jgi:hypothetical protein
MTLLDTMVSDEHFIILDNFTCYENESLETFLKCKSIDYAKESQGMTYIIKYEDGNEILAFYTLKCNAIQMMEDGSKVCMPAVELARLAVTST